MASDNRMNRGWHWFWRLLMVAVAACASGCGTGPLVGIVYTNVKLPFTRDLANTPVPADLPHSDRVLEIKEPLSGLGLYTRLNSNAFGDIARQNGVDPLYFADQEVFSILGVYKTHRVFLYGKTIPDPSPTPGLAEGP